MRKVFVLLCALFFGVASADTLTIRWHVGDSIYDTTTCTVGGDVILPTTPTKRGYTFNGWRLRDRPIEYIESTGTQYINTEISGLLGTIVEIRLAWSQSTSNSYQLNGGLDSPQIGINSQGYWWNFSQGRTKAVLNTIYDTKLVVDANKSTLYVNDVQEAIGKGYSTRNFYLFALNGNSAPQYWAKAKVYSCKIRDNNNNLVRDMIPVLDENGVACMYDKVSKTYFYNAGTGSFNPGPEI